jgi:hypothetical protein
MPELIRSVVDQPTTAAGGTVVPAEPKRMMRNGVLYPLPSTEPLAPIAVRH